jgi:hypothetical protein
MGTGSFPEVNWPGRGAGQLPPSSAELKRVHSYTSTPFELSSLSRGTFTFNSKYQASVDSQFIPQPFNIKTWCSVTMCNIKHRTILLVV